MIKFILASQSPRRRELIQLIGYPFEAIAADVDEDNITHPDPAVNVTCTAQLKVNAIANGLRPQINSPERLIIIGADTTVALKDQMLGKPASKEEAWYMLQALRNRPHHVYTGMALIDLSRKQEWQGVSSATVTMRSYNDEEIAAYIASGDPMDKAGAYAIQNRAFYPVAKLEGCFTTVMGLSVCHLIQVLSDLGVPLVANMTAVRQAHHHYPCPIYRQITG